MDKKLIIQLNEHDAYRVLALVQREAAQGQIWETYWERVANEISADLERQRDGNFFQCGACHD